MSVRKHIRPKDIVTMATHLLSIATPDGECLVLDPGKKDRPYVQFKGVCWPAARLVFAALVEDPGDDDVHHICENKPCIFPEHLERKTRADHLAVHDHSAFQRDKTHCPHGHAYTDENTAIYNGKRICRECNRTSARERWRLRCWGV